MLTIRLTRKGKKNQPFFRVVVIDKRRTASGGRAVEELGYVDPLTKKKSLKKDRILYWISKGAQPSPSMHNLLVSEKIIDAKKIHVAKSANKKKAGESAAVPTPAASPAPTPEAAPQATQEEPKAEPLSEAPASTTEEEPKA